MATKCRARTCLCRATRLNRFSVRSSSATVSVFGGGRRTRTLTGGLSLNNRAKSSSESSSHPTASRFIARRWAAVNFCATASTSVVYAVPYLVLLRLARQPCEGMGRLPQPSIGDFHMFGRRSSNASLACRDGEQSMTDGSLNRGSPRLLLALHCAGQRAQCCRRPTPAPAPIIAQAKATTGNGGLRDALTNNASRHMTVQPPRRPGTLRNPGNTRKTGLPLLR